jgi:translation initiation factor 1
MTRKRNRTNDNTLVYSSDKGKMCPGCNKPKTECHCRKKSAAPATDGIVRVGRETKGRKGKGVSIVTGVPLDDQGLIQLARRLKSRCGSGGTVKNGMIEIQGDHRDLLVEELQNEGFTVKRSGG